MIQKNQELVITIEGMGSEAEGIGRIDGYALFVKDVCVGDRVKVKVMKAKKNYGFARVVELIEPSKDRVKPLCEIARQCGGCQLQHVNYERQVLYKEEKVKDCLERIGKFKVYHKGQENQSNAQDAVIMEPIIGMKDPLYYRNKAAFPIGKDKNGKIVTGFYAARTHSIIPTTKCYIQDKVNEQVLQEVLSFIEKYNIEVYDEVNHKGLVRHILTRVGYKTKEIMVCLVINGKELPHEKEFVRCLEKIENVASICLNINTQKTNVIMGDKLICLKGKPYITDYINDIKFQISPLSFYQVNPVQTEKLYNQALEYANLSGKETVWDLYCGIGTISLFLAKQAKKVYGVEIVPQAIEDAKTNAKINNIDNVEFFVGAAEEVVTNQYNKKLIYSDVVVVDPPRKGCAESLLKTIIHMKPKKVVYVSCDPATLARDLRYLADHGFCLRKVRACDMFPNSAHVETVCYLELNDKY